LEVAKLSIKIFLGQWLRSIYFYVIGRDKKQMEEYIAKQRFARRIVKIDKHQKTLFTF
jgi:hypothetical protein